MIPLDLSQQRLHHWRQTPDTRLLNAQMAAPFIEHVGIATLFPASPEIPNLFSAYVGHPQTQPDSGWSTPSGDVYSWRWTLGQQATAFYTSLVRRRPTWVSWALLPAVLHMRGELQSPSELYETGKLSRDAYHIIQVLQENEDVLRTGELRQQAGFPIGKPQRAAYLKAIAELEDLLLIAKVFSPDDQEMRHALVSRQYSRERAMAAQMTREDALRQLLLVYLPSAVYVKPDLFAKHLGLPKEEVMSVFDHLVATDCLIPISSSGSVPPVYVWKERSI